MTRQSVLDTAATCVNGDRDHEYGSPENNFAKIAEFWTTYLQIDPALTPEDVAMMMILLKVGRGTSKPDTWVDIAGYAACGGEIISGKI